MHSELSIDRHTCTPHRQAHTHVVIGAADCRKGRSRLARLARGRAGGLSSWQQEEHVVQAAPSFSPPGRLSCAAARAMSSRAEYSSFLDAWAISEVIMATRTAAPDDLAPLGMTCCGLRGAWTDVETYRRSCQNVNV